MSQNNASGANITEQVDQEDLSWSSLGAHTFVKISLISILLWFFFRSDIDRTVYRWVTDSSWSHGFLIPLFSFYFLNQNKKQILDLSPKPNYFGLFILISCLFIYPVNIMHFKVAYFQPLIMITSFFGVVLFMGGWRLIKFTWLPIAYLIFAVPLPARLYGLITIPMRRLAAAIATALLSAVPNLEATCSGVVIDVIYKGVAMEPALDVAEACSGMRLLMAFMALGVAMAYLHYRPVWQRIILLCSTIPIAIFCNVVRVSVTGFIHILWDPKYAQGIYHDMLGMLMLPLAFGIYGFLAWMMSNLIVEDTGAPVEDIIVRRRNPEDDSVND